MSLKFKVPMDYIIDKMKKLRAYNTGQEKNMLLLDNDEPLKEYVAVLTDDTVKAKNELEEMAILYKLRMISVSDLLDGVITCPKCGTVNEFRFELSSVLNFDGEELDKDIPLGFFEVVEDILDVEAAEELSIKEYKDIEKKIRNNTTNLLKLEHHTVCWKCSKKIPLSAHPTQILSKSTVSGIYQEIFNLGYFMHNGINDVYSMLPFERELFHKMLQKELDKRPPMT